MCQVISIQSLAGGSGVSYLARSIAEEAVADGQRVLLIDAAPVTSSLNSEADTKYHFIGDVRTLFCDGNHAHWRHHPPPRHGRFAYAAVPGITLKRIDNAKHFIMLDQPDKFAAEVAAFLQR